MRTLKPRYLQNGDTIGICCPAGAVQIEELYPAKAFLEENGFRVKVGPHVGQNYLKYAATDQERLDAFQTMLDDDEVSAILCARGGYGSVRILDDLDFSKFQKNPKWIIGYSDITYFHSHLNRVLGVSSMHGHMLRGFGEDRDPQSIEYWMQNLQGKNPVYSWLSSETQKFNTKGELVGGNLAILSDTCGTNSGIETDGKILVIEDISEYYYNIDRMMMQLRKAGMLENLKALLVGSFKDTKDNEVPFGEDLYDIMRRVCMDFNIPIAFDFPFGHQPQNYSLLLGQEYHLMASEGHVQLELLDTSLQV